MRIFFVGASGVSFPFSDILTYDVDITDVVTRIMPTGEDKDGNVLYLPEGYVDSPHIGDYTQPKWIHLAVSGAREVTKGKSQDKKSKAQCYTEMRQAAQAEFDKGCDLPTITLKVDFINCAETEEYRQYNFLQNIFLGDSVRVIAGRIGVAISMRMTQYTYDCLTRKYTDMTLGTVADTVEGNMISARQLGNGIITGAKLAINSVGAGQLQDGSVGSLQIQLAAIQAAHIEDAAIGKAHIQEAAIGTAQIEDLAVTGAKIAEAAIESANIAEAAIHTAHIKDGAIETAKIDDAAITTAKIGNAAITEAKLEDAAVTTAKIHDLAVDTGKIADAAIVAAKIAQAVIQSGHIEDAAITRAKIALVAVDEARIADLAVGTAKIHDAAITTAKINDLAVTGAKIANATITSANITDATIGTAKIALGAITTALIEAGAVGTAQIADASVTDAKIVELSANRITTGTLSVERLIIVGGENSIVYTINSANGTPQLSQTTIDGGSLTQRSISADRIVAGAITANEIAAATILANNIAAGAITTDKLAAEAVDASKIKAGSITTNLISADFGEKLDLSSNAGINLRVQTINADIDKVRKAAVSQVQVLYALGDSTTEPPESGWQADAPDWQDGKYMWQKTVTTYASGTTEESDPTCLAGAKGESATTLRIDSSRGTVFKNNNVSTVLSVVIYHGSRRITDPAALRSVFGSKAYLQWSWQRMDEDRYGIISADDSRLSNDGFSFTLSAADVDTKVTFLCELMTD